MSGGDVELQAGRGRTAGVVFKAYMTKFSGMTMDKVSMHWKFQTHIAMNVMSHTLPMVIS